MQTQEALPPATGKVIEFAPLQLKRRSLAGMPADRYRVYKMNGEIVTVEARSAMEAYRVSGEERVLRIVREERLLRDALLEQSIFESDDPVPVLAEPAENARRFEMASPTPEAAAVPLAPVQSVQPAPASAPAITDERVSKTQARLNEAEDHLNKALAELAVARQLLGLKSPEQARVDEAPRVLSEDEVKRLLGEA